MPTDQEFSFGRYRLAPEQGLLWRGQQEVRMTPKAFAVLRLLVMRTGQVVTKDEVFATVWPQTVVSDDALTTCILELRQALRDNAKQPRYIETIYGRGYRFIGKVVTNQLSVVSQTEGVSSQEEEKQQAIGAIGLESSVQSLASNGQSLASSVQNLESENQTHLPPFIQTPEREPTIPTPSVRRFWSRGSLIVLGLFLLIGGSIAVHYLSLSRPSTQSPTPSTQELPLPDKPSIAVMPFTNMSGDPEQEYFSDGLTDDLITDLSRLSQLFVIARHSVFTYKGKAVKVQDVSKELGVKYVLEGSVRRTNERIRINAQLVDAMTGHHLWAERYDRPLKDIFALQDEIVQRIVTTLKLQLTLWEQGILVRKRTDNVDAYDYYLRGLACFFRFTKEACIQAQQMFEQAIELDPQYAEAYASLGGLHQIARFFQWSQDPQGLERALALVQQAIALDDSLPSAHDILSRIYLFKKQYEQARVEAEQTIILAPNSPRGYVTLGSILNLMGEAEQAIGVLEQALRLDPRYPLPYQGALGWAYLMTRRYDEAIATQQKALSHNRDLLESYLILTISYSELGREEEARAEAAEVLRLSPTYSLEVVRQTWPYKDPADMERTLAALRKAGLK